MSTDRCELTVRGPLSRALLGLIRSRFDHVSAPDPEGSVLIVENLDQASVRALLTLIWDAGHEVLALSTGSAPTNGDHHE